MPGNPYSGVQGPSWQTAAANEAGATGKRSLLQKNGYPITGGRLWISAHTPTTPPLTLASPKTRVRSLRRHGALVEEVSHIITLSQRQSLDKLRQSSYLNTCTSLTAEALSDGVKGDVWCEHDVIYTYHTSTVCKGHHHGDGRRRLLATGSPRERLSRHPFRKSGALAPPCGGSGEVTQGQK